MDEEDAAGMLQSASMVGVLVNNIKKVVKDHRVDDVSIFMNDVGVLFGENCATKANHKGREALITLFKFLEASGWLKAEWDFGDEQIIVRVYDCFESRGVKSDGVNCDFVAGLLKACTKLFLELNTVYCQEMKCITRGDDHCEFVIMSK